jgi:hypothetical protein
MQCKFKKEDGTQCTSHGAIPHEEKPGYGYCAGHARKLGLIKNKPKKVVKVDIPTKSEKDRKAIMLADSKRLYHKITSDKNYDMPLLMGELKEVYGHKAAREFLEMKKDIFIGWWIADPDTRIPETMQEAAAVLEVKQIQIRSWINSDDFVTAIDKKSIHVMRLVAPHVNRTVSVKALFGDEKAVEIFTRKMVREFGEDDESVSEAMEKYKDEIEGDSEGKNVMLDNKTLDLEKGMEQSYFNSMIDEIEGKEDD